MASAARDLCRTARRTGLVAAWDDVPGLGAVLAAGPDADAFLQSQLTSDVQSLAAGASGLSARLVRTGALVAGFTLFRLPERGQPFPSYLLIVDADLVPALLTDLRASAVSEDVLLEDAGHEFTGIVVQGPATPDLRDARGSALLIERSFTGDPGWLALAPADVEDPFDALRRAAEDAGCVDLDAHEDGATAWDWLRLEAGWPRAGRDYTPGKTPLPQTGLEQQAVSWTKGCYLGQEVVARVRTYGSVSRALRGLVFFGPPSLDQAALPKCGDDLVTSAGKTVGSWASTGWSPVWERPVALVYLDRDHRAPGRRLDLTAGDLEVAAEVVLLPFHAAASDAEQAASLHERAVRLFAAGTADHEAVALLERAIRLDPGLADAYEALGVMLGRGERYHEAIDVFKRLEEVAPEEPMVHTNLSLFYMKIGDRTEAERQLALATMKRFSAGLDLQEMQRQEAAADTARRQDAERRRAMYAEVLEVDPQDALALMGLGNALLDLEDFTGAAELLGRALAAQGDNSPLYVSRGKALEGLGRSDEAVEVYRQGVEVASRKGDLMPLKELEHRLFLLEDT